MRLDLACILAVLLGRISVIRARQVATYVPFDVAAPGGGKLEVMVPSEGSWQVANPSDLYEHVADAWNVVVESNQAGLLDAKQDASAVAPLSPDEAWHHFQAGRKGIVDSARFLITFAAVPSVQAGGEPIHIAASKNNIKLLEKLIEDGANPDAQKFPDGSTPLMLAATMGHVDAARLLIENEANVELAGKAGATALAIASAMGHVDVMDILIRKGNADVDSQHPFAGTTPLHWAAEMGNTDAIVLLCDSGADPEMKKKSTGGTALHTASDTNQTASVETLLDHCKANMNVLLAGDTSPLYLAAQRGFDAVCEALLKRGADPNFVMPRGVFKKHLIVSDGQNSDASFYQEKNTEIGNGATALHAAVENGHLTTTRLLLKHGAAQLTSMQGASPLLISLQYKHEDIALELLADGQNARIDASTPMDGAFPLLVASGENYMRVVKRLVQRGANVNLKNQNGATALEYAIVRGHTRIAKYLVKHGANASARVKSTGATMLMLAAKNGMRGVVEAILKSGVDVNKRAKKVLHHATALYLACQNGHRKVAGMLLDAGANVNAKLRKINITPLFIAAERGFADLVETLLLRGATVHDRNWNGITAMHMACITGKYVEIVRRLIRAGSKLDSKDNKGNTPLLNVVKSNRKPNPDIVSVLVANGADVRAKDARDKSVLEYASQLGDERILDILHRARDEL